MADRRSTQAQVALVLLFWAIWAQLLSSLAFWFYITRADPTMMILGLGLGGGVAGVLGIPLVIVAVILVLRGNLHVGGIVALIAGLVAAISVVAVAGALFALFSPEARIKAGAADVAPDARPG